MVLIGVNSNNCGIFSDKNAQIFAVDGVAFLADQMLNQSGLYEGFRVTN